MTRVLPRAAWRCVREGLHPHQRAGRLVLDVGPSAKHHASEREVKPWSWADTWPVARIEVKRLHASAIVLAGSSGQALAFGPGHVELAPMPVNAA